MSLLQMSFSGAAMIVAITVIRALAVERLPKRTFLVLWGIVTVRLLVPYSLPSPFSVYSLLSRHTSAADAVKAPQVVGILPAGAAGQTVPVPGGITGAAPAGAVSPWWIVWAAGMLICAAVFALVYLRCRQEFRTSLPVEDSFAKAWLDAHPLRRRISIRQSGRFSSPLTYGLFRPVILVPMSTRWEDTQSLGYVLAHEYVHIRRFDCVTKLVLITALCVHWFDPLVWVMYVLANRDLELSCDEAVIRRSGGDARAAYARTLICMEETRSGLAPLCSNFCKNAIEERITSIMKYKKTSAISLAAALALIVCVTTAFATSAPAEEEQELPPGILTRADDLTVMSYDHPADGRTYYSWDGGKTFEPLTDEELARRFSVPDVEWWTYDEYAAWLEEEKVQLQAMLGEKGWTGGRGEFVWTQEIIDETIAMYESILQEIKEGALYSKTVDGDDSVMISSGANSFFAVTENDEVVKLDPDTVSFAVKVEPGEGIFITGVTGAPLDDWDVAQAPEYTPEEWQQIIDDIESGKIPPFEIPDDPSVAVRFVEHTAKADL